MSVLEIDMLKVSRVPILKTDCLAAAAHYPASGPIDTAELMSLQMKHVRSAGVRFLLSRSFGSLATRNGRVCAGY